MLYAKLYAPSMLLSMSNTLTLWLSVSENWIHISCFRFRVFEIEAVVSHMLFN
jgi:hypothetical protein